ncbi:MAG: xanthine dehydrogenase family protein molybdopterin-binding subunit [Alphaproteobacteria bacterium]
MPHPAPGHGRLEDHRFLTGQGLYTANLQRFGMAHLAVVRSPHAHADIISIDVDHAKRFPGVLLVMTGPDWTAAGYGDLQNTSQIPSEPPLVRPPRPVLARDRVRHQGEPVAFVVAKTRVAAIDAAEAIAIDYAPLPSVVTPEDAVKENAIQIWDDAPGNICALFSAGDWEKATANINASTHILEFTCDNHRVSALPLETRAAIGEYDRNSDSLLLTASTQGVHTIKNGLLPVFNISKEKLHVAAEDVGGGFGAKNFVYPEWAMVLAAAKKLNIPVRWIGDRSEDITSGAHGRAVKTYARLGLDAEGHFTGLAAELVADIGGHLSTGAPGSGTVSVTRSIHGIYNIPAVAMKAQAVFTNTAPVDAYRGAGKPEGNYMMERLVDEAARQFGFDPIDLRRKNAIQTFPYKTPLGFDIDIGRFKENIEDAVKIAHRNDFKTRRQESAERGRLRGQGFACFLESARGAPSEAAALSFSDDGMIEIRVGTESNGQGHETTFKRLTADRLGVEIEVIRYIQADTRETTMGNGHGGARSMHMGGTAIYRSIESALEKGRSVASRLLQADPDTIFFRSGDFIAGDGRAVSLFDVASAAKQSEFGFESGLDSSWHWNNAPITWPAGCHVAEVEIDPETGMVELLSYKAVDDYGTLLDRQLTEGQVQGGLAQGIGQALRERIVYDQHGQCLSATLMDYAPPYADSIPNLEVQFESTISEANPMGVKGSGQAGAIAASQTVMNAVVDALTSAGAQPIDMPATPEKVWLALRDAK